MAVVPVVVGGGGNVIYLDDGNVVDGIYIGTERTLGTYWHI
jgi:hypothetical protein